MVQQTRADEQPIQDRLEDSLKCKGLTASHIPVLLALAKASVPGSEARNAAHIDARTATLIEKMEHHDQKSKACWDVVNACQFLCSNDYEQENRGETVLRTL